MGRKSQTARQMGDSGTSTRLGIAGGTVLRGLKYIIALNPATYIHMEAQSFLLQLLLSLLK
jgi:hypothetical protein